MFNLKQFPEVKVSNGIEFDLKENSSEQLVLLMLGK